MSLRDKILAARLGERRVVVPAWDATVIVRELTGAQSMGFERLVASGNQGALGHIVAMCVVDPDTGQAVFTPADAEAICALGMSGLAPVLEAAKEISGIDGQDVEKAKALFESAQRSD